LRFVRARNFCGRTGVTAKAHAHVDESMVTGENDAVETSPATKVTGGKETRTRGSSFSWKKPRGVGGGKPRCANCENSSAKHSAARRRARSADRVAAVFCAGALIVVMSFAIVASGLEFSFGPETSFAHALLWRNISVAHQRGPCGWGSCTADVNHGGCGRGAPRRRTCSQQRRRPRGPRQSGNSRRRTRRALDGREFPSCFAISVFEGGGFQQGCLVGLALAGNNLSRAR